MSIAMVYHKSLKRAHTSRVATAMAMMMIAAGDASKFDCGYIFINLSIHDLLTITIVCLLADYFNLYFLINTFIGV